MSDGMLLQIRDDGTAELYDDTYDITIHCTSQEEQDAARVLLKRAGAIPHWVSQDDIPRWITVSERLPEERDSMFSKFHGTPRWRPSMWLRQSDRVLVTSELADGTRITETAMTRDREWKPDHAIFKREIVAWMPMPKPYKEDRK